MALTLNGTTKWASAKELQRLGETRMGGTPARVKEILERVGAAIAATSQEVRAYIKEHKEFDEIGNRMLQEWEQGATLSLKTA
jgi:serine/threonine-protein kinase HipA